MGGAGLHRCPCGRWCRGCAGPDQSTPGLRLATLSGSCPSGSGRPGGPRRRPPTAGTTHLLFTGLELLRRVASLVPPPRTSLTRFHGVFAPGSKLRPFLFPQAGEEGASVASQAGVSKEPKKERTPRVDQAELQRRTFALCSVHRSTRTRTLANWNVF
ncbi:transposase [Cystobacter fuscus]|uniref:transposase n=1 Tax=Cystobacter fuscus TaxID=43 RepID=UPI0037BE9642